jgi:hypothetical protein
MAEVSDNRTQNNSRATNRSTRLRISNSSPSKIALICACLFLVALGVRALHWQDNRQLFPFMGMTGEYKAHAMLLVEGNLEGFLRGPNPPSDTNVVKHPPGYPIFMAAVYKIFGTSDNALRAAHITLDALSALLVFFIALESRRNSPTTRSCCCPTRSPRRRSWSPSTYSSAPSGDHDS